MKKRGKKVLKQTHTANKEVRLYVSTIAKKKKRKLGHTHTSQGLNTTQADDNIFSQHLQGQTE